MIETDAEKSSVEAIDFAWTYVATCICNTKLLPLICRVPTGCHLLLSITSVVISEICAFSVVADALVNLLLWKNVLWCRVILFPLRALTSIVGIILVVSPMKFLDDFWKGKPSSVALGSCSIRHR